MKKNLVIIGPIGNIGGRELETGFIASALGDSYNVNIFSTTNFTKKSQIFDFIAPNQITKLNELIFQKNIFFKFLSKLSYLKASKKGDILDYVSNALAKKCGYRLYALKLIKAQIKNNDAVIICAQISSNYIKEVVEYASLKKKIVIFRTSNTIVDSDLLHENWLNKVTLFIHHSVSNANRLASLDAHNYQLIDQCTYREDAMIEIEPTKKFKSLLYIGRLSKEKGILGLVDFFKMNNTDLDLIIIGDGELYEKLNHQCISLSNVQLLGFLNQSKIIEYIKESDAVIIPSHEESGPIVGLEAMASARLVISTKVGAMPDRLEGVKNQFWIDINKPQSITDVINEISILSSSEIESIVKSNRERYLNKYRVTVIKSQYKNAIFNLLTNKR